MLKNESESKMIYERPEVIASAVSEIIELVIPYDFVSILFLLLHCFYLVVGFIIMSKVEGIFETQQSIGLEWRDPRLQVEQELQKKKILKRPQTCDS